MKTPFFYIYILQILFFIFLFFCLFLLWERFVLHFANRTPLKIIYIHYIIETLRTYYSSTLAVETASPGRYLTNRTYFLYRLLPFVIKVSNNFLFLFWKLNSSFELLFMCRTQNYFFCD